MLFETLLASWLAISGAPVPGTDPPPATQEQLAAALVDELAKVCAAHTEVERAFVLMQQAPDGSPTYMFIPIFDRDVSDEALNEADAVYQKLYPSKGHLPMTLLARNTWKKSLARATPIYIRPGKQGH